ncbi:PREDICTED: proline-rich transmembrane protein 3 [Condylura cristata]|uniref:proline-rich transmembrane protein 3 n=1 Tax=Condylura cristata TaxID=143302 RepID=UPI000643D895|nr:PREDICTED: proline-rich transmembrane protein 3 [Condylura cristata]
MAPSPRARTRGLPLLLLLLPLALGTSPALGRLPRPLEDSEPHLTPGVHPQGAAGAEAQGFDFVWEKPRAGSPWSSDDPRVSGEGVPERAAHAPPGPALHGPKAAHGAPREALPGTDDLQMARGPGSQGWTGPPDAQEPLGQEAPGPPPVGTPHLTFIPTPKLQLEGATAPPSPQGSAGRAGQRPSGEEAGLPEAAPSAPQGPARTGMLPPGATQRPALDAGGAGGEDFQEAARGPVLTRQDPAAPGVHSASPAEVVPSGESEAQPDMTLTRSLPPADELPVESPTKAGAGETWGDSSPRPSPPQADLPDVEGSPGPQPTTPPASEAPEIAAINGVDPVSPQRVRGAVENPGTPKSLIPDLLDFRPVTNQTESPAGALQPDETEEWPGRPQSHPPAPPVQAPSTSRRGLIRVTTQRALGQPPPPEFFKGSGGGGVPRNTWNT